MSSDKKGLFVTIDIGTVTIFRRHFIILRQLTVEKEYKSLLIHAIPYIILFLMIKIENHFDK